MKLSTAISVTAGGEGSGCHGPKCGRPEGSGKEKLWTIKESQIGLVHKKAGYPVPKYPNTEKIPHSGLENLKKQAAETSGKVVKGPKGKAAPQKLNDPPAIIVPKGLKPQETGGKEMQKWLKNQPPAPKTSHNIEEGDKVILMKPVTTWYEKKGTGELRTFPLGTEATVMTVDKQVGHNEPTIVIRPNKYADPERVQVKDVFLSKKTEYSAPKIDVEEVKKSQAVIKTKTADGADYTVVKPKGQVDGEETRGTFKPHAQWGKFADITGQMKVLNEPMTRSQVFFAQHGNAPSMVPNSKGTGFEHNPEADKGTTVWVYRHYDTKQTVIRQVSAGEYGHSYLRSDTWNYKNMGAASGFLMKKFGITQSLPKKLKG